MKQSLLAAIILILSACTQDKSKHAAEEVIKIDKDFSQLSAKKGMKFAFLHTIDSGAVLLRANHYPIIGKDARLFIENINDSVYTLTWEPLNGFAAKSGELAWTYGTYTLQLKDTAFKGTYVSVWKKLTTGEWKLALDAGNEGVGK
ncbi:hypothetical protein ACI6Q2_09740 [Chitinophagaceae bacterium LWZ2-11]